MALILPHDINVSPVPDVLAEEHQENYVAIRDYTNAEHDAWASTYRTLHWGAGVINDLASAVLVSFNIRPGTLFTPGGSGAFAPMIFTLRRNDYDLLDRTPKLRIRAQAYVNGVAPSRSFTIGLHTATGHGGAANVFSFSANGTAITGSTVAFSGLAANSTNQGNSGDFDVPADAHYCLACNQSGAITANSRVSFTVQLQQRWV